MTSMIDLAIEEYSVRYPDLFEALRDAGWNKERRVDPLEVALEPHWPAPFPMHGLARDFLSRFLGIKCHPGGWRGVEFGCGARGTASSLKDTNPYDVERLVLGEDERSGRPPAFPIGTMNDWMIFMREDWSSITISFSWRDMLLSDSPFEIIDDFRCKSNRAWNDPARHIEVDDLNQVPAMLIGGVFDS